MAVTVNGSGGSMAKTLVNKDGATLGTLEKAGAGKARVSGGLGNAVKNKVVEGVSFSSDNGLNQTGTFAPEQKTVTPTKEQQVVTPSAGKFLNQVTVNPISGTHIEMPNSLEYTKNIGVFDKIVKCLIIDGYIAFTRDGYVYRFDEDFNQIWGIRVLNEIVDVCEASFRLGSHYSGEPIAILCTDSNGYIVGLTNFGENIMNFDRALGSGVVKIIQYAGYIMLGRNDGSITVLYYDSEYSVGVDNIKVSNVTGDDPIIGGGYYEFTTNYNGLFYTMGGREIYAYMSSNKWYINGANVINAPLRISYTTWNNYQQTVRFDLYNESGARRYYSAGDEILYYKMVNTDNIISLRFDNTVVSIACDKNNNGVWVLTSGNDIKYVDYKNNIHHVLHGSTQIKHIFYGHNGKYLFVYYENGNIEKHESSFGLTFEQNSDGAFIKSKIIKKIKGVNYRALNSRVILKSRAFHRDNFQLLNVDDEDNIYIYALELKNDYKVTRFDKTLKNLQVTYEFSGKTSYNLRNFDKKAKTWYLLDSNKTIYVYGDDGKLIYSFRDTTIASSMTYVGDGSVIYTASGGKLVRHNGIKLCEFNAGTIYAINKIQVVTYDGVKRLYIGHLSAGSRYYIECFNVDNNLERIFEVNFDAVCGNSSYEYVFNLYVYDDCLYLVKLFREKSSGTTSPTLYRIDMNSGGVIWTQKFNNTTSKTDYYVNMTKFLQVDKNGYLFFGTVMIDPDNGDILCKDTIIRDGFFNSEGHKISSELAYNNGSDSYYCIAETNTHYDVYNMYVVETEE